MITNPSIAAPTRLELKVAAGSPRLHPVLSELVGARFFEPLAQAIRILFGAFAAQASALLEDQLLDEDLGVGPQRQSDRVARPAVDGKRRVPPRQVNSGEERIL